MGRIGRERNRKHRRAKNQAATGETAEEAWPVPDRSVWDPPTSDFVFQPSETARIVQRAARVDGRLVDFAVMLECRSTDGSWVQIHRIDCRHGTVHRHSWLSGMTARETIRRVMRQEDVEETYEDAYAEVEDHWADIERGWRSGRHE